MNHKKIKAGGIVIKEEDGQRFVLLIHRNKHNDWSFPKGHIEPNESAEQTALREIEEETGLKTEIIKKLIPNKYMNNKTGDEMIVYMYLLKVLTGKLKPEHTGDEVKWIKFDEVEDILSYDNLKKYFNEIKSDL